ncbi:MAG: phosphohistidine phosphatase [Candidatus Sumerlaeota bacterium]|nr:phosphohistidine phosphatase [Candidatus Sumerlaeota bacterium]
MLVLLMRHGVAEDGVPDTSRALTPQGRRKVRHVCRLFQLFSLRPHAIFSSPRVRARQTAEIVARQLKLGKSAVRQTPDLDFTAGWDAFAVLLEEQRRIFGNDAVVLLAGHQPHLGEMATLAVDGVDDGRDFRKGACLGLRFKGPVVPGGGTIDFYLTPRLAKMLKD